MAHRLATPMKLFDIQSQMLSYEKISGVALSLSHQGLIVIIKREASEIGHLGKSWEVLGGTGDE